MISNLLYRKIYGHISEKKKSSCTRDENWWNLIARIG
jgi:hypothetical protein